MKRDASHCTCFSKPYLDSNMSNSLEQSGRPSNGMKKQTRYGLKCSTDAECPFTLLQHSTAGPRVDSSSQGELVTYLSDPASAIASTTVVVSRVL